MAYIGNSPEVNAFTITVDGFNGTGACTQFTLTRNINDPNVLEVVVDGVIQTPTTSYTVTNGLLTFDEAPSSGTNNITVRYLAPVVFTYNQVTASQIQANAVGTTQLASNSVTSDKIAPNTIIAIDIADGSVTNEKIANNSVTNEKIVNFSVTNEKIANNAVTGEKISTPPDIFDDAFLLGGM